MKIADIEVTLIDSCGSDLSCVNAARVSMDKESYPIATENGMELREGDKKLIKYLADHKHFSPFNHAFLSFRVKAPIFVARQLVKHKFMPWNEVSRRYVDDEVEIYFREFHGRAVNVKQGCDENIKPDLPYKNYLNTIEDQLANYHEALDLGAAPEDARILLPLAMMTEWYWSGTLGAVLEMLTLRLDPHTQYDSRIVANRVAEEVKRLFPESYKARVG
jgi:thymidylate synthase (FAD)